MEIYQCMHCGDRWSHGGMRQSFVDVCQHAEETRGLPEGQHMVLVGDIDRLAEQYRRIKSGEEPMPSFNDANDPLKVRVPAIEPPAPREVQAVVRQTGVTPEEAAAFIQKMRAILADAQPEMLPVFDDVLPAGGRLDQWGDAPKPQQWPDPAWQGA